MARNGIEGQRLSLTAIQMGLVTNHSNGPPNRQTNERTCCYRLKASSAGHDCLDDVDAERRNRQRRLPLGPSTVWPADDEDEALGSWTIPAESILDATLLACRSNPANPTGQSGRQRHLRVRDVPERVTVVKKEKQSFKHVHHRSCEYRVESSQLEDAAVRIPVGQY